MRRPYKCSPERSCWVAMRARCNNPKAVQYKYYGGRGITICERWNSFALFLEDMGPRPSLGHSLDRIDPNGNYEPGNVQWATRKQQGRNCRNTIYLEVDGVRKPLAEWAEESGVGESTIRHRIAKGLSAREAIAPVVQGARYRMVEAFGVVLHMAEWERRTGINKTTIAQRLFLGWTPEKALSAPVDSRRGRRQPVAA